MSEKRNFWQTIPGLITGLATIATAALALVPLFTNGNDTPQPAGSPSPTSTASPTTRATGGGDTQQGVDSAPRALIAPKSIDFGRIATARTAAQTVTISNTGTEYLVVEDASVTGRTEVFSAEAQACLEETGIAPDSECEVEVTFAPSAPGSYAGILEIEHSADGSPERVALNGEGALLGL